MKKKSIVSVWTIMLFILLSLCPSGIGAADLTISAAISLKGAFTELSKLSGSEGITFNFGASGDLARQIETGAPVDVFASASQKDMDALEAKGLIINATRVDFTGNVVVLAVPVSSKLGITSFNDLAKPEIKRICMGNPKTVPAGIYALEVLQWLKIWDSVKDKAVLTENVRQALDYVTRDEVDAGIIYATEARLNPDKVAVAAEAPEGSHKPAVYPIAVVKGTRNEEAAKRFIALVISEKGAEVLKKYGFKPVIKAK